MYTPTTLEQRKTETAHIKFYLEPEVDAEKTLAAGHNVYRDVEWCTITPAGANPKTVVNKPVDNNVKARFPEQYRAFKENREAAIDGTDLRNWPLVTPAQVATCRSMRIFSVEQLAEVDEATVKAIGAGGYTLKKNAQDYVEIANSGDGKLIKQIEALTKERNDLTEKLTFRDEEIAKLKGIIGALEMKHEKQG